MKTYPFKLRRILALFLAISLLLAACGGEEQPPALTEPPPAATEPPPPPTEPPPTSTPAPTSTPEPTAVPDVTANFVDFESPEMGVSLRLPADWATDAEFGALVFASSEELAAAAEPDEEGGIMMMFPSPASDLPSADPQEALKNLLDVILDGEDAVVVDGPRAINVNGAAGAVAEVRSTENKTTPPLAGIIAIILNEERGVTIMSSTAEDNADLFLPTLYAMIDSIKLTSPVVLSPESLGIAYGETVTGQIGEDAGQTPFAFQGTAGEIISISVEPTTEDLDVVVDLIDSEGVSLLGFEHDESIGIENIPDILLETSGDHFIMVRGFAESSGDAAVTLTLVAESPADVPMIVLGQEMSGTISGDDPVVFAFPGRAGELIGATIEPLAEDLDVVIDLLDSDGFSILPQGAVDDSYETENLRLIPLEKTGYYYLSVRSFDENMGEFTAVVEQANDGLPGAVISLVDSFEDGVDHLFPFRAAAGDVVTLIVDPEPSLDVVLEVYREGEDIILAEVDHSTGFEELRFTVPEDGDYNFKARSFDETGGAYEAFILGAETTTLEVIANDMISGRFGSDGMLRFFYAAEAGETLEISAVSDDETDVVLRLLDLDGNLLVEVDEEMFGESETLTHTFEVAGRVVIEVSDFFGSDGSMTLFLSQP